MARIIMTIALALTLGSASFTQSPSGAPQNTAPTTAKIDQLFAQWDKPETPGCALAIIKDGQTTYQRGYGMANLELAVPLTAQLVFNVGSIAKQFTAMSILLLAQRGKLSLDDDVRKYVSEVPDFGTPLTLRHLIHHTSGLRDFLEMLEMAGWRSGDIVTEKDILDMVSRQRTLNHKPGDEFVYTNTGYLLLAVIVKRVTGQTLSEFADANIFKPLGMTHTRFGDDHRTILKGLVNGYLPKEGGGFLKWMPAGDYAGSSNLFTTVEDLARWDQNFYEKQVGGEALIGQMLTPGTLNDGSKLEYAHGLFVTSYKGLKTVVHNGSTLGYQGTLHRFPDQHFSVALLCNIRGINPDGLARQVVDLYLANQYMPAPANQGDSTTAPPSALKVSEKELASLAGLYWNPVTDVVRRVYVRDGKLMYSRAPGNESELAALGGNRFLMLGVRNKVEIAFKSQRPGIPLQMFVTEAGGKPNVHHSVQPASYQPQQLAEFVGEYYSSELDLTYRITAQGDKMLFRTGNWGDFLLSPRFVDSFANPQEMGSLIFSRDRKNRVAGFVIRSGKVRNLRFNKTK